MNLFAWPLRSKLLLAFTVVVAVSSFTAIRGWIALAQIENNLDGITQESYLQIVLSNRVIKRSLDGGRLVRSAILLDDSKDVERKIQEIEKYRNANTEDLEHVKALAEKSHAPEAYDQVVSARAALLEKYGKLYELLRTGDDLQSRTYLFNEINPANDRYVNALEDLINQQDRLITEEKIHADESAISARRMLMITVILSVFICGVLCWPVVSGVSGFVRALMSNPPSDGPGW